MATKMATLVPIYRTNINFFPQPDDVILRKKMSRGTSFSREEDHGKRFYQCFHSKGNEGSPCKKVINPVFYASESDFTEKHKSSLEIYLEKLKSTQCEQVSPESSVSDLSEMDDQSSQLLASKELGLLEEYLNRLQQDSQSEECSPSFSDRNESVKSENPVFNQQRGIAKQRYMKSDIYASKATSSLMYDEKESGNFYLISTLLCINIAVFLFEIASPVKSSDYDLYSLPVMYGAKVNDLIMVGQWWRLVTPMFLHTGFMHIALGSWVLLSFGPQVCKRYGSFTFFLIFVLGGISGNFSSFLHTSEPTVGGSGPVFAVIGAWLIYQLRNKDVIPKELSDSMFYKAIIATALSFLLGSFGPMDNWTNLGAAISGIIYGFFTCPVVQLDDASTSALQERNNGIKEEITLNNTQAANPCKSLSIFTLFVFALSSLLFFVESPLENLEIEELILQSIE